MYKRNFVIYILLLLLFVAAFYSALIFFCYNYFNYASAVKIAGVVGCSRCLSTFTTNTTSQLNVFRHNGYTLGMDSAQVGVFKQTDQVGFRSFL